MIRIHQNLHKSQPCAAVYSIRRGKAPVEHSSFVTINNHVFHVSPTGLEKVRASKRRMVFAWVKGDESIEQFPTIPSLYMRQISFNPYKEGEFVFRDTREPCKDIKKLYFTPRGVFAV